MVILEEHSDYLIASEHARKLAHVLGKPVDIRRSANGWALYSSENDLSRSGELPHNVAEVDPVREKRVPEFKYGKTGSIERKPGDYRPPNSDICYICHGRGGSCLKCQGYGYLRQAKQ